MKRKRVESLIKPSTATTQTKQVICISLLEEGDDEDETNIGCNQLIPLLDSIYPHLIRYTLAPTSKSSAPQLRLIQQFYQLKAWREVSRSQRAHVHREVVSLLQSDFYRTKRQIGALSIRECSRLHDIIPYHTEETDAEATWSLYSTIIFYLELERHPIDVSDAHTPVASSTDIIQASDDLCRYFVRCTDSSANHMLHPLGQTTGLVVIQGIAGDSTTLKAQIKRFVASYSYTETGEANCIAQRLNRGSELHRISQFYICLKELHAEAVKSTASRSVVARADAFPLTHRALRHEETSSERCDLMPSLKSLALCVGDGLYEFLLTSQHPRVTELCRSIIRTIGAASRSHAQYAYKLKCAEPVLHERREQLILEGETM